MPVDPLSTAQSRRPFWKELFRPGEFEWTLKMRRGNLREFFAPQDPVLMAERRKWLAEKPEWSLVETPAGATLVEAAWEMAIGFGHANPPEQGGRNLIDLARQWEPDLAFMDLETKSFAAACVCLPSSWDPRRWEGRPLDQVHGAVPKLQEQIGAQINRFLERLEPGKGFCRENWGLTLGGELNFHPELMRPSLDEGSHLDEVYLRVEHQIFTGLPGGVMMGIRIQNCPLTDLAGDPEVWQIAIEKIATMPDEVARYKNLLQVRGPLSQLMAEFAPPSR